MSPRKRTRRQAAAAVPAPTPEATPEATPEHTPAPAPAVATADEPRPARVRRPFRELGPVLLLRTAHPRQALVTALAVAVAAALADRAIREVGLVFATVLVGQAVVGWHNDLVDRRRDEANQAHDPAPRKPLAQGLLDPGTVWFALTCGVLLVVPLALSSGVTAGSAYLLALVLGLIGNVSFRRGLLSWVTWAASYALYPAYLSYGGWGGDFVGEPPEITITALAAGLGVCVHVLRALPGLVADNRDGQRHLPLRIALRIGAPRLLWLTILLTAAVVAGLVVEGTRVGLTQ